MHAIIQTMYFIFSVMCIFIESEKSLAKIEHRGTALSAGEQPWVQLSSVASWLLYNSVDGKVLGY